MTHHLAHGRAGPTHHLNALVRAKQIAELEDAVTAIAEEAHLASAIQVSARGPAGSLDLAAGDSCTGLRISTSTLFNVGCATKPITAVVAAGVLDTAGRSVHEPVGDLLGDDPMFAALRWPFVDVVAHRATLAAPDLLQVNLSPEEDRAGMIAAGLAERRVGYSEVIGQLICRHVIEKFTGHEAGVECERLLSRSGIASGIAFSLGSFCDDKRFADLGFYVAGLGERPVALLHDGSPHQLLQDRFVLGGYASAAGLADFYALVGTVREGACVPGLCGNETLNRMLTGRTGGPFSNGPAGPVRFAGGFCIGLSYAGYPVGPTAVGHPGFMGLSIGVHDPARRSSCAVIANGVHTTPEVVEPLRSALVGAALRLVGGRPT